MVAGFIIWFLGSHGDCLVIALSLAVLWWLASKLLALCGKAHAKAQAKKNTCPQDLNRGDNYVTEPTA